jgi:hypothetical protein
MLPSFARLARLAISSAIALFEQTHRAVRALGVLDVAYLSCDALDAHHL